LQVASNKVGKSREKANLVEDKLKAYGVIPVCVALHTQVVMGPILDLVGTGKVYVLHEPFF
jgi:hypothetical protein